MNDNQIVSDVSSMDIIDITVEYNVLLLIQQFINAWEYFGVLWILIHTIIIHIK